MWTLVLRFLKGEERNTRWYKERKEGADGALEIPTPKPLIPAKSKLKVTTHTAKGTIFASYRPWIKKRGGGSKLEIAG